MMLSAEFVGHLFEGDGLHGWDGPTGAWSCHCCNRVNDNMLKTCKTCGRPATYVPSMHLPLFGTMAKALRREQATYLLDQKGFEVNATDSENWTPAHLASMYGNVDLLQVLVDRGARLEAQTKGSLSTPLHVAADEGFVDICRRLLEEDLDREARDVMDRTALHLAAEKGHLEVVKALLDGGAKADVMDHDNWSPRQIAEFRGFMEVATVLAKGHSILKQGAGATQGASTALPPAPWHTEIFAQARLDAARQRKLRAISAAREGVYSRYANIYKDHAAERYARAIEASRQGKGGLAAYRRRVVAASMDAERYRGYIETSTPRDGQRPEGGGSRGRLLVSGKAGSTPSLSSPASSRTCNSDEGGSSIPSEFSVSSTVRDSAGGYSTTSTTAGAKGGGDNEGGAVEVWLGDGTVSECSAVTGETETVPLSADGGAVRAGALAVSTMRGSGSEGGHQGFVDVVPFNNIRAKYLRPMNDTELSRPYHVDPSPDWRADSAPGSRSSLGSTMGGSASSAATNAIVDTAGSGRTMEYYRKATQRDPVTNRRQGRTLNWKERKEWGAR